MLQAIIVLFAAVGQRHAVPMTTFSHPSESAVTSVELPHATKLRTIKYDPSKMAGFHELSGGELTDDQVKDELRGLKLPPTILRHVVFGPKQNSSPDTNYSAGAKFKRGYMAITCTMISTRKDPVMAFHNDFVPQYGGWYGTYYPGLEIQFSPLSGSLKGVNLGRPSDTFAFLVVYTVYGDKNSGAILYRGLKPFNPKHLSQTPATKATVSFEPGQLYHYSELIDDANRWYTALQIRHGGNVYVKSVDVYQVPLK